MTGAEKPPVKAYIGFGSNQAGPGEQIRKARLKVSLLPGISELGFSSLYSSPPMGPQNQPDYVNAVMEIETTLSPTELLKALQQVEKEQGRDRSGMRWGPRTLDLDIILYGQKKIHHPDLIIPHAGMATRAFVLYPLHEIAPDLMIPGLGALRELIMHCPMDGLQRISN